MPIAGRVYDRFGPRWPAVIGLTIVTAGTYLLHAITLETPREHVMWLMMMLGVGLGSAFMPILTGGVAVIPLTRSNAASALNNVVQRVSGALGLAMFTAILTTQQTQQMAGRAALLPTTTPVPHLGDATVPDWIGTYALYRQTQLQVFVGAIDDLFLIATGLSALGALIALLLRSGPAPVPPAGFGPPATAPVANGAVTAEGHPGAIVKTCG